MMNPPARSPLLIETELIHLTKIPRIQISLLSLGFDCWRRRTGRGTTLSRRPLWRAPYAGMATSVFAQSEGREYASVNDVASTQKCWSATNK